MEDAGRAVEAWNADGLRGKGHYLRHILRTHDVDVALISETHLRPTDRPSAAGYLVYCEKHLAALVRRRIHHRAIHAVNLTGILTLGVELELGGQPTNVLATPWPLTTGFTPRT
ncbi:unnamed protein product [Pieris macdunnoughi]|uniref:Endonuclease/exonuclease/phosphatase domain-containing protein n=1 Tax=Pieris macdunnoughi TaxID=345717 RepID=A0A821X2L8_9NEOP|nr:unnamed protein product [Pieris macdunnoughi]